MSTRKSNWILLSRGRNRVHPWLFLSFCAALLATGCGTTWTGSIGAILAKNNENGRVFVRDVPPDMGAARAGLLVDDEITAIDGKPAKGMSGDDLHQALSGQVGTRVRLQIVREGMTKEVVVERGPLVAPPPPPAR
ncbi:S41 family peptidase [Pendulispora brunnea]|uniref:S41 family peptidase n=1 Tax=Pendulispora brunnea TaxID=2905690 RepID=UPI00374E06A9